MKKIIVLLILMIFQVPALAASSFTQHVVATLGPVLKIKKIIYNGIQYNCGDEIVMGVDSINKSNPTSWIIKLLPVKLLIQTNSTSSILITPTFANLTGTVSGYSFGTSALGISPSTETISSPTPPELNSGNFAPEIVTTPSVPADTYKGLITFTVVNI